MNKIKDSVLKNTNTFETYSKKRVSYIFSTKNRPVLFEKSLRRIRPLVKPEDELIVIDGSTNEQTLTIIKKYKRFIDKYIHETDLSPGHGNNKGILVSEGKYIKLLTDDDIIFSTAIEKAINIMEKNPKIDILECGGILYYKLTKVTSVFYKPPGINFGKNIDDLFRYRSNGLAIILRRKSLAKIGLFPTNLIADATFLINAFKANAIIKFCRIKLYKHVIHSENLSGGPEISNLIYSTIKNYSSKKYFLRYSLNWHISKYPAIKFFLSPVILINNFLKRKVNNKSGSKQTYKWDGGFS